MKRLLLSALFLAAFGAGTAMASEKCSVPKADWQTPEALQQKLESEGWKVKRVKVEDGCFEAYAFDNQGRRVEAYFDPRSLEAIEMKLED